MTNLFVALSNNQLKNCALVLKEVENDNNILVTSSTLNFSNLNFKKIICIDTSFNNRSNNNFESLKVILSKIRYSKKSLTSLNKLRHESEINLYFFYLEEILTNYLFFSFNPRMKGIVIEDGTLNYYLHTIKSVSKIKLLTKWILGKLFNFRFAFYNGHSSGIEYNRVICQYVRAPKLSMFPEKSRQLQYSEKSFLPTKSVLIVGQEPYINLYNREIYEKRLWQLCNLIAEKHKSTDNYIIYYKPHRHGGRVDLAKLREKFPNKRVEVLDADTALEEIYFEKLKSKFIYGFDSSVFINIYLETEIETRGNINFTVLLAFNKQLKHLFKKFNFNIIE